MEENFEIASMHHIKSAIKLSLDSRIILRY